MKLLYYPDDRPPLPQTLVYSLQFLAFNLVNVVVVPLLIGTALGLDHYGIATLAQRTIFFTSLVTLIQALFGHRYPILEGPAGTWWGIFIILATMAPEMGKPLPVLRSDLELGLIAAGLILILFGVSGLVQKALRLFTPVVTGTVMVLLTIQLAGSLVRGALGVTAAHPAIDPAAAVASVVSIGTVIAINLKCRGFVKSIAVFIGIVFGWIVARLLGMAPGVAWVAMPLIQLPELFAWGKPTFDPGVLLVSIISGVLILSNLVAAFIAMERTIERPIPPQALKRGIIATGFSDIIIGLGATVGVVPFAASSGLISITGVAARLPFIVAAVVMLLMGLFPPVSLFFCSIPVPVGYSVLMAAFCQMIGFGLKDYAQLKLESREIFIIGLSLMVGAGIMNLPGTAFASVPLLLRYILGNGFISGMLICILLEHVLLPKPSSQTTAPG